MKLHRAVWASTATAALLGTLLVGSASGADPAARPLPPNRADHASGGSSERVGTALARATGPVTAFVELTTTPATRAYGDEKARGGPDPAAAARAARQHADAQADRVLTALRGQDATTREIAKTHNAVPGVVVAADAASLRGLTALPEVESVRLTVPKSVRNAGAVELTRTAAQRNEGLDQHGGLDGHVQRPGDPGAGERLVGAVALAHRHQAGHLVLGEGDLGASVVGKGEICDLVVHGGSLDSRWAGGQRTRVRRRLTTISCERRGASLATRLRPSQRPARRLRDAVPRRADTLTA
jgi:hypothetical protein